MALPVAAIIAIVFGVWALLVLIIFALYQFFKVSNMSLIVGKPAFCICENKDAEQLRGNREADQCLCFSIQG